MKRRQRPTVDQELKALLFLLFLFFGVPFIIIGLGKVWVGVQERGQEARLRQGTTSAYNGTARKDLELARRALAAGDAAKGEERASRAQDKLASPMLHDRSAAAGELEALEKEQKTVFTPIRRKRGQERFGKAGAEGKTPR